MARLENINSTPDGGIAVIMALNLGRSGDKRFPIGDKVPHRREIITCEVSVVTDLI